MDRTTSVGKVQMVVLPDGERTWTVLGDDHLPVAPVEEFLEHHRVVGSSPNTVKSYAHGLALSWRYLEAARGAAPGLNPLSRLFPLRDPLSTLPASGSPPRTSSQVLLRFGWVRPPSSHVFGA